MNLNCAAKERKRLTAFIDFLIIGILGSALYLIAVQTEAHHIIDQWAEGRRFLGLELNEVIVVFAFLGIAFSVFSLRRWNELNIELARRLQVEEELQESEERYRRLVENAQDIIFTLSAEDSGFTSLNPAFETITGWPRSEWIGKPFLPLIHSDDASFAMAMFQRALRGETPPMIELRILSREYACLVFEITTAPFIIDGSVVSVTGVARDITSRKHAEERIMRQSREIESRNLELSTLYKISSAISCTININNLFSNILNTIIEIDIMKVECRGGILLIDGDKMNLVSHLGHPAAFLDMHKNMTVNDCLCGLAARIGEMIISKNSHTDCHHTINYPGMIPHGHIIIPLKVIDKIVGVLYLYLPVDFDIDEKTIQTFIAIGNQIGIAINNCQLHEKAKMLSLYDPLTKVANRNLMNVEIEKNFERSKRFKSPFSIIMTDLDNFKKYNDTYGHTCGDRLLVQVAKILSTKVRTVELVARYGGEEFLIILPDTELKGAYEVAERIRRSVEAMTDVTLSLGVSSYSSEIQNMEAFIKQADDALYQAKHKGKNRVEVSKTGVIGG